MVVHSIRAFPVVSSVTSIVYTCGLIAAGFLFLTPGSIFADVALVMFGAGSGLALFAMMCIGRASTFAVAPPVARRGKARAKRATPDAGAKAARRTA